MNSQQPQPATAADKDDAASAKGSIESGSKGVRIPRNYIPQNNTRLNPSKKRSRDDSDDDDDEHDGDKKNDYAESGAKSNTTSPEKKKVHLDAEAEAGDVEVIKTDEEEETTEGKRDEQKQQEEPAATEEEKPEKPAEEEKPAAPKLPNPFTDTSTISPFGRLAQGSTLSSFKSPSKTDTNTKNPSESDSKPDQSSSSSSAAATPSQPSKLPFGSLAGGFAASPFATATGFAAAGKPKLSSFGS
ncbi:hypothetical protein KEM56_005252, partial [Ascosphaera pollenicola]